MMNEEKKINDIFGKENHFKVPEGYFDNFAEQMMAKIPVQEIDSLEEPGKELLENKAKLVHLSLWRHLPLRKIAAVLAVTAMLGGGVLYQLQQSEKKHHALAHKELQPLRVHTSQTGMMQPLSRWLIIR